ncbi:hypothetical protein MRX96_023256 [Rhipicephalus microplus]
MAECPLARCAQERRAFRKEFQRWSRDMLFVIGLERVAEEMMGSKRWNRMTQLENALEEQFQLTDWVPDQVCYFCDAQRLPVSSGAKRGRQLIDGNCVCAGASRTTERLF